MAGRSTSLARMSADTRSLDWCECGDIRWSHGLVTGKVGRADSCYACLARGAADAAHEFLRAP